MLSLNTNKLPSAPITTCSALV